MHTSTSSGGESTGTSYANAGGSVRWIMRVESQPGYAGPATIDVDLTGLIDVNGSVQVSGFGSAGGTYNSEYSIRAADPVIGTILLVGNGALAGALVGPGAPLALALSASGLALLSIVLLASARLVVRTRLGTSA